MRAHGGAVILSARNHRNVSPHSSPGVRSVDEFRLKDKSNLPVWSGYHEWDSDEEDYLIKGLNPHFVNKDIRHLPKQVQT